MSKNIALVVDDVELNREILTDMLENYYDVLEAGDGLEAEKIIIEKQDEIAVVLLDLMMPVLDGFGVLEYMQRERLTEKLPVLIISGDQDPESERRCLEYGATDFVKKPFNGELVLHRIRNAEKLYSNQYRLNELVAEQTKVLSDQRDKLDAQNRKLRVMNGNIIELLSNVVEARSLESGTHVHRVKGFTRLLAQEVMLDWPEYGLTPERIETIVEASAMHDIGKIMIPDAVLNKPGKLTDEEFALMKTHTLLGLEVLDKSRHLLEYEHFRDCRLICRSHHEKWDGKGYPDGLKGEEIPLPAQLVSVADCYDALTTERVYKKAIPLEDAFNMILEGKCGAFNPKLMESFKACRMNFEAFAKERVTDGNMAAENEEAGL